MMKKNYLLVAFITVTSLSATFNDAEYRVKVENNSDEMVTMQCPIPARTVADICVKLADLNPRAQLHRAILANSKEDVLKAIQAGADVNCGKDDKAPLLWAVLLKKDKAVEALLECGADVSIIYNGVNLIDQAVKMGHSACEIVIGLLEKGAPFSEDTVIKYAFACSNHGTSQGPTTCRVIDAMLLRGCNINAAFATKFIPFMSSLLISRLDNAYKLVRYVLDKGLNPNYIWENNVRNCVFRTSMLYIAIERDAEAVVEMLLNAGADIQQQLVRDSRENIVHTPISFAVSLGKNRMVELLLRHGAKL